MISLDVEKIAKETSLLLTQKAQELGKPQTLQSLGKYVESDVEDVVEADDLPDDAPAATDE